MLYIIITIHVHYKNFQLRNRELSKMLCKVWQVVTIIVIKQFYDQSSDDRCLYVYIVDLQMSYR